MQTIKDLLANQLFGFVLKMVAGVATAFFAVIGLGRDARNKSGQLLPRGRVAIVGIVAACLLGLGSVLYDYFSAQKASAEEKAKSEKLLRSAQRGIYPLRDFTITTTLPLNAKFKAKTDYLAMLHSAISEDRFCKKGGDAKCIWSGNSNDPDQYQIPFSSKLFPIRGSQLYVYLDNLQVRVELLKSVEPAKGSSDNRRTLQRVGDIFINWHGKLEPNSSVIYRYKDNTIRIEMRDFPVQKGALGTNGAYSLVDFNPGLIAAYADYSDDGVCADLRLDPNKECSPLIEAIASSLSLDSVEFNFPYPKNIEFTSGSAMTCNQGGHHYLVQPLIHDVDDADLLGNVPGSFSQAEVDKTCDDFKNAPAREIR